MRENFVRIITIELEFCDPEIKMGGERRYGLNYTEKNRLKYRFGRVLHSKIGDLNFIHFEMISF